MMNNVKTIKRTIRYGVIKATKNNKEIDLNTIFQMINKLDFGNNERYQELSDGVRLAVILKSDSYPMIEGIIGDSRAKELPVVESKGTLTKLNLKQGSGLFDASHFLIFKNSNDIPIIIYEFNIRAPRIERLSQYIMTKFSNEVDYFAIEPISSMSVKEMMKNIKSPSRITIKAHNSCSFLTIDKSLSDLFDSVKNVSDCDYITIDFSLKRGRKEPVSFKGYENIGDFMESPNANFLSSFKIQYSNKSGEKEIVELLDLFLHDKVTLPTMADDSRFVDSEKVYENLKECKLKQEKVLNGVKR